MMLAQTIYDRYKRYRTLQTDRITSLPLVVLMPHSACNCRCIMCDIWKDNRNLKQLTEKDVSHLLGSLKKLRTQKVLMSGGEALLNPNFFRLCELIRSLGIRISLLSTGLLLKKYALEIIENIDDVIVSLDGDESIHDEIRNIPGAYQKLNENVRDLKTLKPGLKISGRTVIQQKNFRAWPSIIEAAKNMGLDSISFLPADVSSHAFNREVLWSDQRQQEILPRQNELEEFSTVTEYIIKKYTEDFKSGFIAENPVKLRNIHLYYSAIHGLNSFPYKKCNAPWVSSVVEADGSVRPCFFHASIGNIHDERSFEKILNDRNAIAFRRSLDIRKDPTCEKCVCYLHLSPSVKL